MQALKVVEAPTGASLPTLAAVETKRSKRYTRRAAFREATILVPGINILVLLWKSPPSREGVQNTLNAIGVVAALVLSLVVSAPMSVTYDELVAADARFQVYDPNGTVPFAYFDWWYMSSDRSTDPGYSVSESMAARFTAAVFVIVTSLVSDLVAYFFFSIADVATHLELKLWWKFGRWVVSVAMLALLFGIIFFLSGLYCLMLAKFPDNHLGDRKSIYLLVRNLLYLVILMGGVAAFMSGLANRTVMRQRRKVGVVPIEDKEDEGELDAPLEH